MPPVTPRSTRATLAPEVASPVGDENLALGDLFEGHREVILGARLHERGREVVEGALAELVVVVVDLAGALGAGDHQAVARLTGVPEELIDPWIHHLGLSLPESTASTRFSSSATARSTSSLTTTWSKSWASSI